MAVPLILATSLGALMLGLVGLFWAAQWSHGRVRAFTTELQAATLALEGVSGLGERPDAAISSVQTARQHIVNARAELMALSSVARPVIGIAALMRDLPEVGRPAQQLAATWELADAGSLLGEHVVDLANAGVTAVQAGPGAHGLVQAAPDVRQRLVEVSESLRRANAARAEFADPGWPFEQLAPSLAQWDVVARRLGAALQQAIPLADALPAALGEHRPMTYLVLIQTEDDLRATGGFITSIGTVQVSAGRIIGLSFEKVYAAEGLDVPTQDDPAVLDVDPPAPLIRYMGMGQWRLRDANWWADVPTSARQVADFWEAQHGVHVDGVVAINERGLAELVDAVGGVVLADGSSVSGATLKQTTLARVFSGEDQSAWYAAQTVFSQELARAMLVAIEAVPGHRVPALAQQFVPTLERRDVLIVSFDQAVARLLEQYGLDGQIPGQAGAGIDLLALVEQNVSYGKLSPFLRQRLEYTVELDARGRPLVARLVIDAENAYAPGLGDPGYPQHYYDGLRWNPRERRLEAAEGFYGGFTRVLLPAGSQVTGAMGFDEGPAVSVEGDHAVVGGYLAMQMGARRRVQMEWTPAIEPPADGAYRLVVRRQPGALDHPLVIHILSPAGTMPEVVGPAVDGAVAEAGRLIWSTTLDRDRSLSVRLRPVAVSSTTHSESEAPSGP